MNTSDLVAKLARKHDLSKAEARRRLDDVVATMTDTLADDTAFTIPGLGTFEPHEKEERKSYNPHEEQYMMLPPKRTVHFKPAKKLKEKVH